jgi:hypothetical protein
MSGLFVTICALSAAAASAEASFNIMTDGVGALGDSYVEEYANQPPDKSQAMNFVEILNAARGFNFGGLNLDTSRGEPRLAGFEFNWGRDTARSADVLSSGQHTGIASQAATGQVKLALLFLGGNDFRDVFLAPDPVTALQAVVPQTLTNVGTAMQTILASNPDVNIAIANVPNLGLLPEVKGAVAMGLIPQQFVDAVTGTIQIYNSQLSLMAAGNPRIAVVDAFGLLDDIAAGRADAGFPLDLNAPAHDYDHLWVDTIHAGTVGHALLANEYIGAVNTHFGGNITPLSNADICAIVNCPEPSLAVVTLIGLASLVRRRRRPRVAA